MNIILSGQYGSNTSVFLVVAGLISLGLPVFNKSGAQSKILYKILCSLIF